VLLNPEAEAQLYVVAPDAVSVVLAPVQMATSGLTVTIGKALTVTGTVYEGEEHPFTFTLNPIFLTPLLGQLSWYGPWPEPEITFAPLKFQL
jgi:hypothetical protein